MGRGRSKKLSSYSGGFPPWLASLMIILLLFSCFILSYWHSVSSLTVRLTSVKYSGRLSPLSDVLRFTVGIEVENKGLLPVNVRNLTAKLYLEDVELGYLEPVSDFAVPAGSKRLLNATLRLTVSKLDAEAMAKVLSALMKGELKLRVWGYMTVSFLLLDIQVGFNSTSVLVL